MSISRDSVLYYDIEDILVKKLPDYGYPVSSEIIKEILDDLFDSVALHVWSREDIKRVAQNQDKLLTAENIDEILSNIERHVDCDLGITWQSIEVAVDDFYVEGEDE